MSTTKLSKSNFSEKVLKSKGVFLVDFYADWCGPCQMIAPILEEIAQEFKEKLKIGKINIDENEELASQFNVMSIPNLIFFKDGKQIDQVIGAVSKEKLIEKIKENLKK